eukprot:420612-Amorphochlora_amoeboformis.AAC.1
MNQHQIRHKLAHLKSLKSVKSSEGGRKGERGKQWEERRESDLEREVDERLSGRREERGGEDASRERERWGMLGE